MNRILYIEDDPGMQVVIPKLIKTCDRCFHGSVELIVESSFAAGEARIQDGGIDVVLLDQTLPPLTPDDTQSLLAARADYWPPTLIVTGSNDIELRQRAIALGAADYVFKDTIIPCPEAFLERVYNAFLRHTYEHAKRTTRP